MIRPEAQAQAQAERRERRRVRGLAARRSGRWAEVLAAAMLMARGWRILGFRLQATGAEIDLLAVRGKVLAVVEVKARTDLATALQAVSADQASRLIRAGEALASRRFAARGLSVRLDLVALAPGRLPRHIPDAWGYSGARSPRYSGAQAGHEAFREP